MKPPSDKYYDKTKVHSVKQKVNISTEAYNNIIVYHSSMPCPKYTKHLLLAVSIASMQSSALGLIFR